MKDFKFKYILFFSIFLNCFVYPSDNLGLLVSPGELSSVHKGSGGIKNCSKCHTDGKKVDSLKCLSCHKELEKRIKSKRGFHSNKKKNCSKCHPEHLGKDFKLIEWNRKKFSHSETGYSIEGLHKKIEKCEKCHNKKNSAKPDADNSFLIKSTECSACHKDQHKGALGKRCGKCHSVETPFKSSKQSFDHNTTRFKLKWKHKKTECKKCHIGNRWNGLKFKSCSDCHKDPHNSRFGRRCSACHNEKGWRVSKFDHNHTRYPLKGKHRVLKCSKCHRKGKSKKIEKFRLCTNCHLKNPHDSQFKDDCSSCHTVYGFRKNIFSHESSDFKLKWKHKKVNCNKCHLPVPGTKIIRYKPIEQKCETCHKDIHLNQFEKSCKTCHSERGFKKEFLNFIHNRDSKYPLTGKHFKTDCSKCHLEETGKFPHGIGKAVRFKPISISCINCHRDIHKKTLGDRCEKCHNTKTFKIRDKFDHSKTKFSLNIFHEKVRCEKCHPKTIIEEEANAVEILTFEKRKSSCLDCHKSFDHNKTSLPLTGKHSVINCGECHNTKTPNLKRLRKTSNPALTCQNCHKSPHIERYKTCTECHNQDTWIVDSWR